MLLKNCKPLRDYSGRTFRCSTCIDHPRIDTVFIYKGNKRAEEPSAPARVRREPASDVNAGTCPSFALRLPGGSGDPPRTPPLDFHPPPPHVNTLYRLLPGSQVHPEFCNGGHVTDEQVRLMMVVSACGHSCFFSHCARQPSRCYIFFRVCVQ